MAERDFVEQLDRAVERWLSGAGASNDAEIMALLDVAAIVRDAPAEEFRLRLKAGLTRTRGEETMQATQTQNYVREGMHTVNLYPVVKDGEKFLEFLRTVFGGEVRSRVNRPDGKIMHCEVRVEDTVIEFGEGNEQYRASPMAFHVYVPDADATYERALAAGAVSLHPMTDQPYGDREGSARDDSGNNWYIATHQGGAHKPEGLRAITPYLSVKGADGLINFMKRAFGASEIEVHRGGDGSVAHAKMRIGDSTIELSEAHGQWGPMGANLHVYVPDTDAAYAQAVAAGATSQSAPADAPYGDRAAGVVDAWGNQWWLATYLGG